MSTLLGHSALHALHMRQRSSTSYTQRSRRPEGGVLVRWRSAVSLSPPRHLTTSPPGSGAPDRASRSAFARPRVLSFSSSVARKDGHMAPPWSLRHTPEPLHSSID